MKAHQLARLGTDPIARLRRLRGEENPSDDSVREAFQRLFKTKDGQIFLNWMIAQSYGRSVPDGAPDSALRANEVRKRFLDQIVSLAEDTSANSKPDTPKRKRRPNQP